MQQQRAGPPVHSFALSLDAAVFGNHVLGRVAKFVEWALMRTQLLFGCIACEHARVREEIKNHSPTLRNRVVSRKLREWLHTFGSFNSLFSCISNRLVRLTTNETSATTEINACGPICEGNSCRAAGWDSPIHHDAPRFVLIRWLRNPNPLPGRVQHHIAQTKIYLRIGFLGGLMHLVIAEGEHQQKHNQQKRGFRKLASSEFSPTPRPRSSLPASFSQTP